MTAAEQTRMNAQLLGWMARLIALGFVAKPSSIAQNAMQGHQEATHHAA